jgi:tetratricopeptide (TPR) repeat protein
MNTDKNNLSSSSVFVCVPSVAKILCCLLPFVVAAKPATKPAEPERVDPLILFAVASAEKGDFGAIEQEAQPKAEAIVAQPAKIDAPQAVTVATVREFGRYFGRLTLADQQKKLLTWLIQQPKLAPTLMMAIAPEDPPDGVLAVLQALYDDQGDKLEQYPDLVAAFCCVWDATGDIDETPKQKIDLARVVRLYHYYTAANKSLRFDVKDLPWQLSTWVVANPLSEEEILWARDQYLQVPSSASTFFDPPWRNGRGYVEKVEKDGDLLLTLPNLAKHGGSLPEKAHFAMTIARTLGVPGAVCHALRLKGEQGPRPAWVAMLELNGRRVRWNLETARLPENLGWRGVVTDPQTFTEFSDSELSQLADLQPVSLDNRLASVAIWKLLDVLEERKQPELLLKAIDISPGNLRAWKSLMDLAEKRKLSNLQAESFAQAIEKYLVKNNGIFAYEAYLSIVKSHGTMQQADLLDRPAKWFADRPEYLAMVRLEQGEVLEAMKKPDKAIEAYRDSIAQNPRNGPLVLAALERADKLLRDKNAFGVLVAVYADAWPKIPRPRPAAYSQYTPWVIIGHLYAQALDDAGKPNEARNVRGLSDSVHTDR